jgi:predicted nucleotidyltransferase component of viral defense system
MKKEPKNIEASVMDRLRNIAKNNKVNFNWILKRYAAERFLHRISISDFRSNLILKGAMMFLAYNLPDLRPTKDIDFAGMNVSNSSDKIKELMIKITSTKCNDGISFNGEFAKIDVIKKDAEYNGVRVLIPWKIGKTGENLHVDIGFGDKIFKGPIEISFPSLLSNSGPKVITYSLETALAEKAQIIVSLNYYTSRAKDFYDIHFLCSTVNFKLKDVRSAILQTFLNRGTKMEDFYLVFSNDFINNKEKEVLWRNFLSRENLNLDLNFSQLMSKLKKFFIPIIESNMELTWSSKEWRWEK